MNKIRKILPMLTQTILLFIIIIDAGMSIFSRNNLSAIFINENYELKPLIMYYIRFTIMVAIIFIIEVKCKNNRKEVKKNEIQKRN